jgi:hypothetical protein
MHSTAMGSPPARMELQTFGAYAPGTSLQSGSTLAAPYSQGYTVSAIKLFVGFGVDDHLIRELMRFIEMICGKFKKRMMYRLEDPPN